jgi:hypothetical protein
MMQNTIKKITLIICCVFTTISLFAQEESFKEKFLEANTLIEEKLYHVALPLWLELQNEQPDNNNLNYKIGLCYIESQNQKSKALDYLTTAAKNVSNNYDPFSHAEKKAPIEVYYYLARAQHLNYKLDDATANFSIFKDGVSKNHYLYDDIDRQKAYCANAKIAVANPVKTTITNMGDIINSKYEDYSPAILFDESTIYFTSRRLRNDSSNLYITEMYDGKHNEDIYVSNKINGVWSNPETINITTTGHEAIVNVSMDGKTMYLYQDDKGDGNIYQSILSENGEWSYPTSLDSNINQKSQETHAHLSPDGKSLYFVSDRKDGTGGKDIYVCEQLSNGKWGLPQNIGNVLNTSGDEDGVFIHPDGKTMYFSSTGHNSIGGYDVFSSKLDANGKWSKPVNMGYPVNTTDNDLFFVTSADGKRGYYSSHQASGFGEKDIYQVSLIDETAKSITLLAGTIQVHGYDTLPANAIVTITQKGSTEKPLKLKPRKVDGNFSAILQPGTSYHITYFADTYTKEEDVTTPIAYHELKRNIILNFSKPEDYPITNATIGRARIEKLKAEIARLEEENSEDWNFKNEEELTKLKAELAALELIKTEDWSQFHDNQLDDIEARIKKLVGVVLASYQEFFNYNNETINTSHPKYINVIEKVLKERPTGFIYVNIETSASHVPTKTFGSNDNLAKKRAEAAKSKFISSLANKGIKKENIIFNTIKSSVNGPKYNSDYQNKDSYKKYQYVTITVK